MFVALCLTQSNTGLLDTSIHFLFIYFPIVRTLLGTSTLIVRHIVLSNTVSRCLTTVLLTSVASSNLLNTSVVSFESAQKVIGKACWQAELSHPLLACKCIQRKMFIVVPRISILLQELLDHSQI